MEIEYQHLDKFVGTWNTEGKIPATDKTSEMIISGKDIYEWLPGKFFLLHKVDVLMGDSKNETFEIIGYDKEMEMYTMQHYDNKGNSGFMTATYKSEIWTFLSEALRFTGGFQKDYKEFSGIWEQSDGKNWKYFMDIKLTKT
jgi:hypothetical protein